MAISNEAPTIEELSPHFESTLYHINIRLEIIQRLKGQVQGRGLFVFEDLINLYEQLCNRVLEIMNLVRSNVQDSNDLLNEFADILYRIPEVHQRVQSIVDLANGFQQPLVNTPSQIQ